MCQGVYGGSNDIKKGNGVDEYKIIWTELSINE
jgi:hypothetical protein